MQGRLSDIRKGQALDAGLGVKWRALFHSDAAMRAPCARVPPGERHNRDQGARIKLDASSNAG